MVETARGIGSNRVCRLKNSYGGLLVKNSICILLIFRSTNTPKFGNISPFPEHVAARRRCREDVKNFWMVHKPRTMPELYSHLFEEVELRLPESRASRHWIRYSCLFCSKPLPRICTIRRSGQFVSVNDHAHNHNLHYVLLSGCRADRAGYHCSSD